MPSSRDVWQGLLLIGFAAATMCVAPVVLAEESAARVPLVSSDTDDPIVGPIFQGIKKRGGEPLNMHRAVANSPKVFKPYVDMALALRSAVSVPRADGELIILRTAQLRGGMYEYTQHRPMAMSCGLSAAQLDAMKDWRKSNLFSERQSALLAYVDGMISPQGVDDATFARLRTFFNDQQIVELTMTSAFYGAVSQITRALDVKTEKDAGSTAYGAC